MQDMTARLQNAFDFLQKEIGSFRPQIVIVPGSGWAQVADIMTEKQIIEYSALPEFPQATFHKGAFTFGNIADIPAVLAGRLHYYEGLPVEETVMPLRLMKMLGVDKVILTNASGAVNPDFAPGEFMVIEDHIQLFLPSPLRGRNLPEFGERFPDMSCIYSPGMQESIIQAGRNCRQNLHKGIYCQTPGPQFETPAEIRMLAKLGADAVGMSTATEAVAARHAGMEVAGISCISNMAAGIANVPLSVKDISDTAARVVPLMQELLHESVKEIFAGK
ncbi:MAG: purine-nucleoside phosphorylase [Lentisphaeria bacterium]|nr:purine-nucleoside phosphorylase [Lentisphaeria bacterium]